ncbi:MAG: ATP-binding protein [Lacunisphaera sp.]|nr:ATP-binding protein [Lacunisphaera sp.]
MNNAEATTDPAGYYQNVLANPLLAPLANFPSGDELKKQLEHLPPVPNAAVRAFPAASRLTLLTKLRHIHVPLGRDVQLAALLIEMIRDGYSSRPPTAAAIARRASQVAAFAECMADPWAEGVDFEAVGAALIGMSGSGKTRTLKRVLRLLAQIVEFDVRKNPLLPAKMITYMCVECPSNHSRGALISSIFTAIEKVTGEKLPPKLKDGNVSQVVENVAQACLDVCLGVLIIDEIQHILRRDGEPEPQLLNFLVELGNKLQIPILIVGTPLAQKVVGNQMRQARRMLGPEWSNLKKDKPQWADFIGKLWKYQFTAGFTPFEEVSDKFYELTQGVPALAVTLFRVAQRYAIEMEGSLPKAAISDGLLQAVYDDHFKIVDPMVKALASGDPERISLYEDLKLDGKMIEEELLRNLADYKDKCRIKMVRTATNAYKRGRKLVKAAVGREANALANTYAAEAATTTKLLDAHRKAIAEGTDPAQAVSNAAA